MVGEHFTFDDASTMLRYFVADHLGSIAVLTDEVGNVAERDSYDAWGRRRNPNGSPATGNIASATTRGFTGQEHISNIGLINFNARIYDPEIGRFMSPDSVVENPYLSQMLNRYSYVGNNPLSFTDPTGHFGLGAILIIAAIVAVLTPAIQEIPILGSLAVIATAIACGPAGPMCAAASATIAGEVAGIRGGDAGDIAKAFVLTFAEAEAFSGVGDAVQGMHLTGVANTATTVVGHGLVGGTFSVLNGGKFGSGFIAAGVSALAAPIAGKADLATGTVISAVAGGVGSVLGGGKFANGAVTGAFGYLFNQAMHGCNGGCAAIEDARAAAYAKLPYGSGIRKEWGAIIYIKGGDYFVSDAIEGTACTGMICQVDYKISIAHSGETTSAFTLPSLYGIDGSYLIAEFAHTHPDLHFSTDQFFSSAVGRSNDTGLAEFTGVPMTMRYNNVIRIYDPAIMSPRIGTLGSYQPHPGGVLCSGPQCF
jgi:RHS repeat-associated protein